MVDKLKEAYTNKFEMAPEDYKGVVYRIVDICNMDLFIERLSESLKYWKFDLHVIDYDYGMIRFGVKRQFEKPNCNEYGFITNRPYVKKTWNDIEYDRTMMIMFKSQGIIDKEIKKLTYMDKLRWERIKKIGQKPTVDKELHFEEFIVVIDQISRICQAYKQKGTFKHKFYNHKEMVYIKKGLTHKKYRVTVDSKLKLLKRISESEV